MSSELLLAICAAAGVIVDLTFRLIAHLERPPYLGAPSTGVRANNLGGRGRPGTHPQPRPLPRQYRLAAHRIASRRATTTFARPTTHFPRSHGHLRPCSRRPLSGRFPLW